MKRIGFLLLLQLMAVLAWGQYSIKGIIKGNNEPLAGASVVIQNTFSGQSADAKGKFEFKNLKPGDYTLKFTFIGFESKEETVNLHKDETLEVNLKPSVILTDEIMISGTRAKNRTPVAYTDVTEDQVAKRNMGQDIPYLLSLTPSFVSTSDAGAGVGYTYFRIRGTDMNRINVTVNGIPLNDPESHGTWFVDQPDLASSLANVQIQRGVGTSSNGAAAFGATINLQTNNIRKDPYSYYKTATGTFNTFKNTVEAGTGLLGGKFTVDARLSKISSDGFIDRAFSDLKSFFVSAGYYTENTILKADVFSGFEETYQAWNGVPSVRLNNDLAGMQQYADNGLYTQTEVDQMIASNSRTYNLYTYKNQVDHYQQDHYQLHFSHRFNTWLNLNTALFYVYGRGYYENYKENQDLAGYQMTYPVIGTDTITSTNLVNRKWLDNNFYGGVFSLNYRKEKSDLTIGGGWNNYDGKHFGKVIWAEYYGNTDMNHDWYRGTGVKEDYNIYTRYNYQLVENLNLYADLQYRHINYQITGIDDNLRNIGQTHLFDFFNPKFGIFYKPSAKQQAYFSYGRAHREPNRDNYVDTDPNRTPPVYETLNDFEAGYNYRSGHLSAGVNFYYMKYKNQLILTGEINDVGNPVMVNVDDSYRAGAELMVSVKILDHLQWDINTTLSRNKIKNFTEYVDDWDTEGPDVFSLGTTDLAFSPDVVTNSIIDWIPMKNLDVNLSSSWVGKQYIDNTSNNGRSLNAYFVNNLNIEYTIPNLLFKELKIHLLVNNLFNAQYESNAWVYSYIYNGVRYKMDGYFPQAGINYMAGVDLKF